MNSSNPGHSETVSGSKYEICDEGDHSHYGEVYYDIYTPQNWGDNSLAWSLHNELYTYPNFEVVRWTNG